MKTNQLLIVLLYFFTFSLLSQNELPIHQNNLKLIPLKSLSNSSLQTNLEKELNLNPKWKSLMSQNRMAVGVIDLSNPKITKYASINGNHMMYAASLPKISILLAAMDAIEKGELIETEEVTNDMKIMISKSSNQAATRMIDRLGYDKIASVMTHEKYELYNKEDGGGLWVGKRYGGGGDTNREPILNLSHAASVDQVCKYYYLLANGKLVNPERSKQMLDIMENPALHHKFVNTLDQIAPNARLFRKSGSWKNFHSDSILVWGKDPKRRYILVALIDDESGEQIIRSLVKPIEKVLKKTTVRA
ncbi:serine hydrolase [Lutibacter sp.]|uniref:serine hydrolase n=1 Tax=Lutibacter sp. TaxID=1925666 RepID=UPI00349FDDB5